MVTVNLIQLCDNDKLAVTLILPRELVELVDDLPLDVGRYEQTMPAVPITFPAAP